MGTQLTATITVVAIGEGTSDCEAALSPLAEKVHAYAERLAAEITDVRILVV